MHTLTMQDIADLAHVRRPVVTTWRSRYAATDVAFPAPESHEPLLFDAAKVTGWLTSTGRGNNPEAGVESALHSTAVRRARTDVDRASTLLLAHHLFGEPLSDADPDGVARALGVHRLGLILDAAALRDALGDAAACQAADELAEAAFSGGGALDRLVDGFVSVDGPWSSEALTSRACDMLGGVVTELYRASPRAVVPVGSGGLLLVSQLVHGLSEHERPMLVSRTDSTATGADRAAWRRLAAHGFPIATPEDAEAAPDDERGRLYVALRQTDPSQESLRAQLSDLLVDLADEDLLVLVGPAPLLTDRRGRRDRARLLTPSRDYVVPLRYAARLPRGLSRFGGRRRLALWVVGRPASDRTVVGALPDVHLDDAAVSTIAADVAASIADPADVAAHTFGTSSVRATRHIVHQEELVAPPSPPIAVPLGGERLARIWGLCDALLDESTTGNPVAGVDLEGSDSSSPNTVSLAEATPDLAREHRGARVPAELLGPAAPGTAHVIGREELRDPSSIGGRGIDRLVLEQAAAHAPITEPGDVVYDSTGGPTAIIDEHGGHVVLAPARIVRCRTDALGRRLVPSVVAADIATQSSVDRRTWRLRTVPAEQCDGLAAVTASMAERRRRLQSALQSLDSLERELVGGVSDGTLHATPLPTPKAAR